MTDKEYIERREAILAVTRDGCTANVVGVLFHMPAADAVEVRHGIWTLNKDGSGTCDQCGTTQKNVWDYDNWQNYCGCCGADMRYRRKEQT